MIRIFTTEQSKEIDRHTIAVTPVSSIDLVERAARAFTDEFTMRYENRRRVIIFAGQGNNGADALAIARMLAESMCYEVETFLFNPPSGKISPECDLSRQRLKEMYRNRRSTDMHQPVFVEVSGGQFFPPVIEREDIVIDGLFGSGLNRPLEGGFANIVKYINASGATVVSIDIPSGLFGENNSGNVPDAIIRASLTLSFGFPKLSFLLPGSSAYVGKWKVLDIGLVANDTPPYILTDEDDAVELLQPRPRFAHKGTFGHAFVLAGSRGKMGAALLAAKACLRSGAGLLTVHVPACGEAIMQAGFPEAMLSIDGEADFIGDAPDISNYSAVGIGPGLGKNDKTVAALRTIMMEARVPLVLDADALNIISENVPLLDIIPRHSILTPHPREFDRLTGNASSGSYERLQKASAFAVDHACIVVLKGAYSAVCTPDGRISFNSTGNSGMATAGSGDVLTGIITGLLASGYKPETAAVFGVFMHGLAGDLAVTSHSEEAIIASDIIENLGKAFRQLRI
jgi:NAD(P)H-hydrate epimerase